MNDDHVTTAPPPSETVTASVEPAKARKARQSLTADQRLEAADMLAAGHRRTDVADHYNIHWTTLYATVPVVDVTAAKVRRAERIAAGLEVLPEVVRGKKQAVHAEKPVREKPAKISRPRGEALMKMTEAQRTEAADMLAAGHRRKTVADHFAVTSATTYKRVTVADVIAAKARRAQRIADGLEVLPEVARTYKGKPVKVRAAALPRISAAERAADKQRNKARNKAIKAHEKLKAAQAKKIEKIEEQYLALSEQMVALRASIARIEEERAKLRLQRQELTLSVPPLDLSAFEKPAPAPVAVPVAVPAPAAVRQVEPTKAEKATVPRSYLPKAMKPLPVMPPAQPVHRAHQQLTPVQQTECPPVPATADLLLVPLTAASNTPMFRQQHQPPSGWTPSELWNGFIAINANLRQAHKLADANDPLIDKLMLRFAIQRYTPERIAQEGDDFIREHRAEKLPGRVREVFLLVSHKKHQVLGEVWQDRKPNSMTPQTVFVLDPLLPELPKLDNLQVLLPNPNGKGQKYSSFTPTRSSHSPD